MLISSHVLNCEEVIEQMPIITSVYPRAILVVEDVAETRDGIEHLLKADGYHVEVARDKADAILSARLSPPDLILVSLAGLPGEVIESARQIREEGYVSENVPVVIFSEDDIAEGDEVSVGCNVYATRPDNFNQMRSLLIRLLGESQSALNSDLTIAL